MVNGMSEQQTADTGRNPTDGHFKTGCKAGPGRPPSLKKKLSRIIRQALNKELTRTFGRKMVRSLLNQAAAGDRRAFDELMRLAGAVSPPISGSCDS
jgi:hypothetical protein